MESENYPVKVYMLVHNNQGTWVRKQFTIRHRCRDHSVNKTKYLCAKKPKEKHALFKIQSRKERRLAAVEGWSAKITARSYLRYDIQAPFILTSQGLSGYQRPWQLGCR